MNLGQEILAIQDDYVKSMNPNDPERQRVRDLVCQAVAGTKGLTEVIDEIVEPKEVK